MTPHQSEVAELLASLPENAVFLTTAGQACITLPGGQTFPLSSAYFRDYLAHSFFRIHGTLPAITSVREVISGLRSSAHAAPKQRHSGVRIAASGPSCIHIDLAGPTGESVEITPTGWQITRPFEVAFLSTRGQLALPTPQREARSDFSPSPIPSFLTPPLMDWLLAALHPTGPYPILILHGPPGSGKSTLARMLRSLIDPVTAPIQPLPSRGRAILESAVRDRVLVFDHVTRMSNSVADALCQISSGTGVEVKEPHDPGRDALRLDLARPVILTTPRLGVHDWQPRPDLAHRAITIEVTPVPTDFDPAEILATLYTALSESFGQPWHSGRPLGTDLCPREMQDASCLADPLFPSILALVASAPQWTGTATDLSTEICVSLTPRSLSHRLRQLQQTLSIHGISVEFSRLHAGIRTITITNQNLRHPPPAVSPPAVINEPVTPSPRMTGHEEVLPCNSR